MSLRSALFSIQTIKREDNKALGDDNYGTGLFVVSALSAEQFVRHQYL